MTNKSTASEKEVQIEFSWSDGGHETREQMRQHLTGSIPEVWEGTDLKPLDPTLYGEKPQPRFRRARS